MLDTVRCGHCGTLLSADSQCGSRCPKCRSSERKHEVELTEAVKVESKLKFTHRSPGKGKFRFKHTEGDDLFREIGKWNKVRRVIDRVRGRYEESVIDGETDEVIREVNEPLDQHIGRGTRPKK
jgi:phage FluMu protein Com